MKKKKIIIIVCVIVATISCVSLAVVKKLKPDIVSEKKSQRLYQTSEEDKSWKSVSSGTVSLENKDYLFSLDADTTHFSVTHKESGKVYHSVPQKTEEFQPDNEQMSEVIVTYYDNNSAKTQMNSYENSVEGKSYEIKTDGEAIRVYYSIQKSKERIFVPEVMGQKEFEEKILSKMESGPKRRLKSFYTLYVSENDDSETNEMKEKYPTLEDENLYILGSAASEHLYSEITEYFDSAGYTEEAYTDELERLGLAETVSSTSTAAFVIPIEYRLTGTGFSSTILSDRITSVSSSYSLTDVSLLPYFESCGYEAKGWQLVPDGSGAIIELADKQGVTYSQTVWGNDVAIGKGIRTTLQQNVGMPILGMHTGSSAFLEVISGGAAVSTVHAETFGNEFLLSRVYVDFNVLAWDSSDVTLAQQSDKAAFNLYASDYVAEFPQVTYLLFAEENTTYSDMASAYQEYLVEEGVLGERLKETDSVPLYLDFTGYETTDQSIMGIATKVKTPLSTLEEIEDVVGELKDRGVEGTNVRLKAYANEGLYGTVSNGFVLDKCVGTEEELEELASNLKEQGGRLYLENNISTVYTSGNSFQKLKHAIRDLRRTVVTGKDSDLVESTMLANKYYLTSPAYYDSLTENYIQTFSKAFQNTDAYGYSWSDFGTKLYSDFNRSQSYDRTQTVDAAVRAIERASESFGVVLTDGSNQYALQHADTLLNVSLNSSDLSCESYSIPFYQMVVHGYVDYTGAPMNTSADAERTYLASIESGANLYYSFYTSEENPLKETQVGTLMYPTWIGTFYDDIEKQYTEFQSLFQTLRCKLIVSHQRITNDVFVTLYEDGTAIVVNYGETDYSMNGKQIPANGFEVQKGGGNT